LFQGVGASSNYLRQHLRDLQEPYTADTTRALTEHVCAELDAVLLPVVNAVRAACPGAKLFIAMDGYYRPVIASRRAEGKEAAASEALRGSSAHVCNLLMASCRTPGEPLLCWGNGKLTGVRGKRMPPHSALKDYMSRRFVVLLIDEVRVCVNVCVCVLLLLLRLLAFCFLRLIVGVVVSTHSHSLTHSLVPAFPRCPFLSVAYSAVMQYMTLQRCHRCLQAWSFTDNATSPALLRRL
jgi:hypothetical protein